jgi:hypothetical protein
MSIEELAAQLRSGDISDDALAEYAVEYAQAEQVFQNKKDD